VIVRHNHRFNGSEAGGIVLRALVIALLAVAGLGWWLKGRSKGTVQTRELAASVAASASASVASAIGLVPVVRVEDRMIPLSNAPPPARLPSRPANSFAVTATNTAPSFPSVVVEAQLALARMGISPGPLDGILGSQTRAALSAFYSWSNTPMLTESNALAKLSAGLTPPAFTNYIVTSNDLGRLLPLGQTWLAKSQQERLDFEAILELVAERFWSHPKLIRRLNPGVDWTNVSAGTALKVPNVEPPPLRDKAAFVKIFVGSRILQAFDENTNLLAHFPCSIAQRLEKRPVGEQLEVAAVADMPNYTFDPEVFPESAEAQQIGRKLILQPGPNNPVGTVWIGLNKPGYGIHGTPRPEDVGRTESHGCFRLANWNAELLFKLVWIGMPVFVEP
jgi:lipoprotein-anchoring transpeptidase ErfK/SrfK